MVRYIHQHEDWPNFRWDNDAISHELAAVRHRQGRLLGRMESLGFDFRSEAVLQTLTEDVIKSSEIEGENLDREQVRSSIARRLGMDIGALAPVDLDVEGVVEMMLDATRHYADPLTEERLFAWHAALFPTGRNGMMRILVGEWRDDRTGPMQVVSGPVGSEKVHYEASPASSVTTEMQAFLNWCNAGQTQDPVLKAAIAHLWFVTIHPFEDGNGRMARAIGDLMLARSEQTDQRFYSLSAQIRQERKDYYAILEAIQKGDMDITSWLHWFLEALDRAFDRAELVLGKVIQKARFWDNLAGQSINDRQRLVLNCLLGGFEGKLTSSKWAKLAKTSPDTALRDINDLVSRNILVREAAGGRSTSYRLVFPEA